MIDIKDKIYTFSVSNDDGSNRIEISRTSGWEGLKLWEQLNMFKMLLLAQSWTEDQVKNIRLLDDEQMEDCFPIQPGVLEVYRS